MARGISSSEERKSVKPYAIQEVQEVPHRKLKCTKMYNRNITCFLK